MRRTFRTLAVLNGLLLASALLYKPEGEDPAGTGLRLGFALFYAVGLAIVLLLFHFVKARWVRVTMLVLLTLPMLAILYGVALSLGA